MKMNGEQKITVSLTSFPEAIPYAVQAIRSVLGGSLLPDRVVLYLDSQKFPGEVLPEALEALKAESPIFEVRFDPAEIRSYKKLIPALRDFPEDIIVTVDDDIFYHRNMLRDLVRMHRRMPEAIIAHRVRKISMDRPYNKWRKYKWYDFLFRRIHAGYTNLQTGVGGVLYPPHSLDESMLDAGVFTRIAPTADDIWFWAAAVAKGTKVAPVPFGKRKPQELGKPDGLSLRIVNFRSGVDRNSAMMKTILEKYPVIRQRLEKGK